MQSLARSIRSVAGWGLGSARPSVGRVGSAPLRWWPTAYAREGHLDRRSRIWIMQNKTLSSTSFTCASTKYKGKSMKEKVDGVDLHQNPYTAGGIWVQDIIKNSTHRDGAIYKDTVLKRRFFDVDLSDHNETRVESMMVSKSTGYCVHNGEGGFVHFPQHMLQFFSLTLEECHVRNSLIELYGFIAARDDIDWMRNYIFNRSRDDPIIVQQGSLIEMTGPKRAIEIACPVLIEFDMRIRNGEQEEDDLQLIDGAFECNDHRPYPPLKHRIYGNCGTVDMSLAYVEHAVEAIIEIIISDVHGGFTLSLSSFIEIWDDYEEIQLFHGTVGQPMGLKRFVVAVPCGTVMLLKFKLGNSNCERCCSFQAQLYGYARQKIDLGYASVSVKVTWSAINI